MHPYKLPYAKQSIKSDLLSSNSNSIDFNKITDSIGTSVFFYIVFNEFNIGPDFSFFFS